jgi:hypothetical protein
MRHLNVKIKGKTFGEIPTGTIFKFLGRDLYYIKIETIRDDGYISNAVSITSGRACRFLDCEKIEKQTWRLTNQPCLYKIVN